MTDGDGDYFGDDYDDDDDDDDHIGVCLLLREVFVDHLRWMMTVT